MDIQILIVTADRESGLGVFSLRAVPRVGEHITDHNGSNRVFRVVEVHHPMEPEGPIEVFVVRASDFFDRLAEIRQSVGNAA